MNNRYKLITITKRYYSKTSEQSLSITDPLIIYQSYISRGLLKPDNDQFRIAVEFQKLYHRVKDYTPQEDVQIRIRQLVRQIEQNDTKNSSSSSLLLNMKPTWTNKTMSKRKDLIKILSDEEELTNFPSPHGILLNGEVGVGKSMLMDIFAKSLPHESKMRWHYSNFMLWVYNEIHQIQKRRNKFTNNTKHSIIALENEFILFEIATKMIRQNTVLLLDEFMLPDLAAAKIIKLLFTYFFKLGGVLIATSNRLPQDLYSNDFRKKEFESFLKVLQARCHSIDMNSKLDYRELLSGDSQDITPYYSIGFDKTNFNKLISKELSIDLDSSNFEKDHIIVYGREVTIPKMFNGIVCFQFDDICKGLYGPSDYISLASNYHTFIIENVPVLKLNMKNEARRFITLLDALYESNCKLFIQLQKSPDELIFPESKNQIEQEELELNRIKVQEEEMFSKTSIALTSPYRPNISYYDDEKIIYDETGSSRGETQKNIDLSDYTNSKAFTGEDERFAYKRAISRLKEMTCSKDYRLNKIWKPLNVQMRPWENVQNVIKHEDVDELDFHELDEVKTNDNYNHGVFAPMFSSMHFWSVGLWGKGYRLKDEIAKKWIKGNIGL